MFGSDFKKLEQIFLIMDLYGDLPPASGDNQSGEPLVAAGGKQL